MVNFFSNFALKYEMPTKIDVAAATAQDDIAVAIHHLTAVSTRGQDDQPLHQQPLRHHRPHQHKTPLDLSSPLFRDEAQHQEMRYLDRFLGSPSASSSHLSRGNENSSSRSVSSSQSPLFHRSKISTILSAQDSLLDAEQICRDGKDGNAHENDSTSETNRGNAACPSNIDVQKSIGKYNSDKSGFCAFQKENKNLNDSPTGVTNHSKNFRPNNSQHGHSSTHNYPKTHNSPTKATTTPAQRMQTSTNVTKTNTRTERKTKPSIHRRQTIPSHRKILKNARISSQKMVKQALQWGKRCTQRAVVISDFVHRNVRQALWNIHSILEGQVNHHDMRNRNKYENVASGNKVGGGRGCFGAVTVEPEPRQRQLLTSNEGGNNALVARNDIANWPTRPAPSQKSPPSSAFKLAPLWAAPVVRDVGIRNAVTSAVRQSVVRDTEMI